MGWANCSNDDHLGLRAQVVQELLGAGNGLDVGDDFLDLRQAHAVTAQHVQAELHELVVVGLIARGAHQVGDACLLRERDPDLRCQHAFQVQTYDIHSHEGSFHAVVAFASL